MQKYVQSEFHIVQQPTGYNFSENIFVMIHLREGYEAHMDVFKITL